MSTPGNDRDRERPRPGRTETGKDRDREDRDREGPRPGNRDRTTRSILGLGACLASLTNHVEKEIRVEIAVNVAQIALINADVVRGDVRNDQTILRQTSTRISSKGRILERQSVERPLQRNGRP